MKRRQFTQAIAASAALSAFPAYVKAQSRTLRVGVLLPRSGVQAGIGQDCHRGVQVAAGVLRELGLPAPDVNLGVGSGSHAQQTAAIMAAFEPVLLAHRPDVLVLDLNMPVVDGFTFLNLFTSLPNKIKDQSRIVVLTSSNSVTDREQVYLYKNVIHMITKPMKQSDIEALRILVTV